MEGNVKRTICGSLSVRAYSFGKELKLLKFSYVIKQHKGRSTNSRIINKQVKFVRKNEKEGRKLMGGSWS